MDGASTVMTVMNNLSIKQSRLKFMARRYLMVSIVLLSIISSIFYSDSMISASQNDRIDKYESEIYCSLTRARMLLQIMRVGNYDNSQTTERLFLQSELVGLLASSNTVSKLKHSNDSCAIIRETAAFDKTILVELVHEHQDLVDELEMCLGE